MASDTELDSDIPPDKTTDITCSDDNTDSSTECLPSAFQNTSEVSLLASNLKVLTIKSSIKSITKFTKADCNYANCATKDESIIVCGECNSSIHYKCTQLPPYQLHRFVTPKNYRNTFAKLAAVTFLLNLRTNVAIIQI